jgi:hypothetical protein
LHYTLEKYALINLAIVKLIIKLMIFLSFGRDFKTNSLAAGLSQFYLVIVCLFSLEKG